MLAFSPDHVLLTERNCIQGLIGRCAYALAGWTLLPGAIGGNLMKALS